MGGRKIGDLFEWVYFDTQGDTLHSQCIRSAAYDGISMDVRGLAFTLAGNDGSNDGNDDDSNNSGSTAKNADIVPSPSLLPSSSSHHGPHLRRTILFLRVGG